MLQGQSRQKSTMIFLIIVRMYVKRLGLLLIILTSLYIISFNLEAGYQNRSRQSPSFPDFENLSPSAKRKVSTRFLNLNSINKRKTNLNCAKGVLRSRYCVVSNIIRAKNVPGYNDSVTLTTQGTAGFLKHIREVCKRWQAPISLAVYAPGSDFELAGSHARTLKNCGQDKCVSEWVTWHVIYDVNHQPNVTGDDWLARDCQEPIVSGDSYVNRLNLVYPINVARNVARLNARTKYVFASDIELYPSLNIVPEFLKMTRNGRSLNPNKEGFIKREVYVLPVFEVSSRIKSPPTNKRQLVDMYKNKKAVSFHRYTCDPCHKIPDLDKWLYSKLDGDDGLGVFKTAKRNREFKLSSWEPFFIGTNDFPLFDETLSWNGKNNKMQVALEMCYMDYDFHILDKAFLVHAPGIKVYNATREARRNPFIKINSKKYRAIRRKLKILYSLSNIKCS